MKNILIFTASYPYGSGETYLEAEIEYLSQVSNVTVVPLGVKDEARKHRELPPSVKLLLLKNNNKLQKIKAVLKSVCSKAVFFGVLELVRCGKLSATTIKELAKFIYAGESHYQKVISMVKANGILLNEDLIAYSYWMDSSSYMVSKLGEKGCISCSRTHGGDLYDERTPWKHQFLRKYIVEHLDFLCPISFMGKEYLERRIGKHDNIVPMHLGIQDEGAGIEPDHDGMTFVSCSAVIPLKRIDLIVEALSKINQKNVCWVHFGEGPELEAMKKLAGDKLTNICFEFRGQVSNAGLKAYYKTKPIKAFINASETEGVPVSIMEAMSFGIPAIATDVGGVGELVQNEVNGILVPANSSDALLSGMMRILSMSDTEYAAMRQRARNAFLNQWEYKNNYGKFYRLISESRKEEKAWQVKKI